MIAPIDKALGKGNHARLIYLGRLRVGRKLEAKLRGYEQKRSKSRIDEASERHLTKLLPIDDSGIQSVR